ncbi:MAG: hypothetical protein JWN28_100 [Candidatus Saccharibacteria bacterium]|nr:hypothetical protein [Candidatus Saccharibacteria bacterium]
MQNDTQPTRSDSLDHNVISYRPERPGYNFQPVDGVVVDGMQNQPDSATVQPDTPAVAITASVVDNKKPFTLANAIVIFAGIMLGLMVGYFAYITWFA